MRGLASRSQQRDLISSGSQGICLRRCIRPCLASASGAVFFLAQTPSRRTGFRDAAKDGTEGHFVLLFGERFLFTGDHLFWSRDGRRLGASRDYCWDSWPKQIESMQRLAGYRFEWVLPGHGQRVRLPANEIQRELAALVGRMRNENP